MNLSLRDTVWVWLEKIGVALVALSIFILLLTFFPVLREEAKYQLLPKQEAVVLVKGEEPSSVAPHKVIVPVDENFGIIIPKIRANARVIADVDWQDSQVYQRALVEGVAHAKGTAKPGEPGNVFLFSHSGVDFFEANRYNALFYLIDKLVSGDEIIILYQGKKFTYQVTEKKIVASDSIEYVQGDMSKQTLTLMTCWPAGTTLKRLIVTATEVDLR